MRRLKKNYYLALFCSTVGILGLIRWVTAGDNIVPPTVQDTITVDMPEVLAEQDMSTKETSTKVTSKSTLPHPIRSVPSYSKCFPDLQDVQIISARKHGVSPVQNRQEAETRKKELVYIGSNPYYKIDPGMGHSIPYLVPRAAMVLETIARNYLDSLHVKGVPLHKVLVSSVLRTNEDIKKLMRINPNASPESCHRYGTTFDIAYNRYHTVAPPDEPRRTVQNDTLKWVLSEVLRDLREGGMCHIKYEVNQGCFHITAR